MSLRFDDSFVRALPADPLQVNRVRQVRGGVQPGGSHPGGPAAGGGRLAGSGHHGGPGRRRLDRPELAEVFAGNRLMPGMVPYAANYGGHQSAPGLASSETAGPSPWVKCWARTGGGWSCS